jgi:enoyl-CoA hydratase
VFSAGADRDVLTSGTRSSARLIRAIAGLYDRIDAQPLPIIAWLNGPAIGAGAFIALLCDVRFVSSRGMLEVPGARYGIAFSPWMVRVTVRELGQALARQLLMADKPVSARAMLHLGIGSALVNKLDSAVQKVEELAALSAPVLGAHRRALQGSGDEAEKLFAQVVSAGEFGKGLVGQYGVRTRSDNDE